MATVAAIATVVGAVSGVVSARKQAKAAKNARRAQEKAAKVQNKQSNIARQRAVRRSLAQSRVLRAQTLAGGFSSGLQGSSIVSGAVGGIQSDVSANIGASGVQAGLEGARVGFLGQAGAAQTQGTLAATQFGAISSTAGLFSDSKNNRAFANTFGI